MNSNIKKLVLMTSEELKVELHNMQTEQKKEILKKLSKSLFPSPFISHLMILFF
jgi:hypothetical protein